MKIKFGAIVTDGRGKIGGHVASKNRGGAYLRTKVTPSNPNTVAQANARGLLASLSQGWSGLATEQRLAWNGAVSDWSKTDIFGDIKNPSGLNLYVKLNANLSNVGLALLVTPPAKLNTPTALIKLATYSIATGILHMEVSDASADTNFSLIRATPMLSAGVSFVKTQFRVIGNPIVDGQDIDITGAYSAKFGEPSIGSHIFLSCQFVLASGQKTVESKIKVTVTA